MPSTISSSDASGTVYERRVAVGRVRRYRWPPLLLNLWILVMLVASCTVIGVFANFIDIQNQLELPIPW
jgi:hypothetical protein